MVLHHSRVVFSHPVSREQFAGACIYPSRKYSLDLIDRFLLLLMGLTKPPQNALLIPLKLLRFAVFCPYLYNLLLNRFVLLLADGGPLLRRHSITFFSNPLLAGFNLPRSLLHLFHLAGVLLLLCLEQLDAFLFDCVRMLLTVKTQ